MNKHIQFNFTASDKNDSSLSPGKIKESSHDMLQMQLGGEMRVEQEGMEWEGFPAVEVLDFNLNHVWGLQLEDNYQVLMEVVDEDTIAV